MRRQKLLAPRSLLVIPIASHRILNILERGRDSVKTALKCFIPTIA